MKSCRNARRDLYVRSDDRLPFERELALDAHLEMCADCRVLAETLGGIDESLARWPEPASDRLDLDAALAGIHAKISESGRQTASHEQRSSRTRIIAFTAVAAAALIALIVGRLALRADQDRSNEASTIAEAPQRTPEQDPLQVTADSVAVSETNDLANHEPIDVAQNSSELTAAAPVDSRPTGVEPMETTSAEAGPVESEPIDIERVHQAREHLRVTLLAAASELPRGATTEQARVFAAAVDDDLRVQGNWPWQRMSERVLREGDEQTARAAARYLGVNADRMAIAALASALTAPDLPANTPNDAPDAAAQSAGNARAQAAAFALRDAGATDHVAFAEALRDHTRYELTLAALAEAPQEDRARLIGIALREMGVAEEEHTNALFDALAASGPAGLDALLDANARGVIKFDALASLLQAQPWAANALLDAAHNARRGASDETVVQLCAQVAGVDSLNMLTAQVIRRELRSAALAGFVAVGGPDAFAVVIRLHGEGRLYFEEADATLHAIAAADETAATVSLQRALVLNQRIGSTTTGERVAGWVLSLETPAALPALRVIIEAGSLDPDLRRDALLRVAELGSPEDLDWLLAQFGGYDASERRIAAACLIAIYRSGGDNAAEQALENATTHTSQSVMNILRGSRRRNQEPSIHRLARALNPVLVKQVVVAGRTQL